MRNLVPIALGLVLFTLIFNHKVDLSRSSSRIDVSSNSEVVFEPTKENKVLTEKVKPKKKLTSIDLSDVSETAIHEAAHYVIYMILCKEYGMPTSPEKLTIVVRNDTAGVFKRKATEFTNSDIEVMSSLAGEASESFFLKTDALACFNNMNRGKGDLVHAKKYKNVTFQDFLAAKQLVINNWGLISIWAKRLQREKTIYF